MSKAAIFNTEGTSVWASSAGFTISPQEMGEVIACYKDNAKAFSSGFHIAGTKYLTIKADDRSLYGKQVSLHGLQLGISGRGVAAADIYVTIGKSRHHHRQDEAGHADCVSS